MQLIIIVMLGATVLAVAPFLFKVHLYADRGAVRVMGNFAVLLFSLGCQIKYSNNSITLLYGKQSKIWTAEDLKKLQLKKQKSNNNFDAKSISKFKIKSIDVTVGTNAQTSHIEPYFTAIYAILNSVFCTFDIKTTTNVNIVNIAELSKNCIDIKVKIRCNIFIILSTIFDILLKAIKPKRGSNERSRNKRNA